MARHLGLLVSALFVQLALASDAPVTLLEAGGVATASGGWDWDTVSAPSATLCKQNVSVLLSSDGHLAVLEPPTPSAVPMRLDDLRGSSPWHAAAAAGSWLLAVRSDDAAVLAISLTPDCRAIAKAVLSHPAVPDGEGWTSLTSTPSGGAGIYGASLVHLHATSDGAVASTATVDLPPLGSGCAWRRAISVPAGRMLALARCGPSDGRAAPPTNAFLLDGQSGKAVASASVAASGGDDWVGVLWGDPIGGGGGEFALAVTSAARAVPLAIEDDGHGGVALTPEGAWPALDAAGRRWSAAVGGGFLGGSAGSSVQLLALREYDERLSGTYFVVNTLVFGAPHVFQMRMSLVERVFGQVEFTPNLNVSYANFDTGLVKRYLTATHTNSHNSMICFQEEYDSLLKLLNATVGFEVDGRPFRVWAELAPPTEVYGGGSMGHDCVVPADSPLTPFNETALFNASLGYMDYVAWAELLGRLGRVYPQLVAIQVDDFTADVPIQHWPAKYSEFTPALVGAMTNAMRTHSPLMSFIPCVYYYTWPMDHKNVSVFKAWPDLFLTMDLPMYWFRNEKQGTGACAEERCVPYWGPTTRPPGHEPRSGGCLAGPCAEETLGNLFDEVQDVLAALTAPGRKVLHLGMYATGHTTFGTPTEPYVRAFPELALSHPNVRGVWSGCGMLAPCGPIDSATSCEGNGGYDDTYLRWLCAKGCAIAESYGELAMREGLGLGMGLE